jgi:hypothetical protein
MTFFSKIVGCLPTTHSTTPSVVIKDARLGFLKFFFTLCIISYVGIYSFLVKKGWAAEAIVSASAHGQFIMPPANPNCTKIGGKYGLGTGGCYPFITPSKEIPYCSYNTKGGYNVSEYTKDEVRSHQLGRNMYHERVYVYVKPDTGTDGRGKRQCAIPDNSAMTVQMGDALFLTTWMGISMNQEFGRFCPVCTCAKCTTKKNQPNRAPNMCIVNETAGIYTCDVPLESGYLAPLSPDFAYAPKLSESFTLQLEHSYTAQNIHKNEVSSNMIGFVAVSNEELCNSLDEANPEKDPYQPNTKYMGDIDNDLGFLMKHDDSTICLLNLNRTYACMVERNKELAKKNGKLDASWYGHKTVCQEDHYLVSTLLLASWDKSNSYATPLLDSPNLSVNKTCEEEPATLRGRGGVCPEDKSQGNLVENFTVLEGDDISSINVLTSYTYEPTPIPYVYQFISIPLYFIN